MPRLFVAIDFPEAVRARLATLAGGVPGARWVPAEQLHLTLRFIGEVDRGRLDDIAEALAAIDARGFAVRVKGVGHFPPRGAPRVLWAGIEDGAGPARLHGKIEAALARLGVARDRRKFFPHVTLARLRGAPLGRVRDFLALHAGFASEPVAISAFHLYSSLLGTGGAVHRIEASYALAR